MPAITVEAILPQSPIVIENLAQADFVIELPEGTEAALAAKNAAQAYALQAAESAADAEAAAQEALDISNSYTAADVKLKYESNADTNAFTDAEKSKLAGIAPGATANTGTVTSVGMAVPTGFTVSGSPITDSGTITLGLASGYALTTSTQRSQWNSAYSWGNHAAAGYLTASSIIDGGTF